MGDGASWSASGVSFSGVVVLCSGVVVLSSGVVALSSGVVVLSSGVVVLSSVDGEKPSVDVVHCSDSVALEDACVVFRTDDVPFYSPFVVSSEDVTGEPSDARRRQDAVVCFERDVDRTFSHAV